LNDPGSKLEAEEDLESKIKSELHSDSKKWAIWWLKKVTVKIILLSNLLYQCPATVRLSEFVVQIFSFLIILQKIKFEVNFTAQKLWLKNL
jgi:hypothetical protein